MLSKPLGIFVPSNIYFQIFSFIVVLSSIHLLLVPKRVSEVRNEEAEGSKCNEPLAGVTLVQDTLTFSKRKYKIKIDTVSG